MSIFRLVLSSAVAVSLASSAPAFDKNPNKKAQEKKDNERVREAQDDVKDAREKLKDAEREFAAAAKQAQAADQKEKAALRALDATREKVEERLGRKVGYERALSDWKSAQREFDEKKAPLIAQLQRKPEYVAAAKAASEAMEQLKSLRTDKAPPDAERKAKASEWNRLAQTPGRMEAEAVEQEPSLAALRARIDMLQKKVASLKDQLKDEVDRDPEMKSAEAAAREARADSKKADEALGRERRSLAQLREKLSNAEDRLQKSHLQDKKNDGKKGKG